jgi:hypothetical protein
MAKQSTGDSEPYGCRVRYFVLTSYFLLSPFRFSSDMHDSLLVITPHLSHASPYTKPLLVVLVLSLFALIPIIYIIPVRLALLTMGLAPIILNNPWIQSHLIPRLSPYLPSSKSIKERLTRLMDDDNLTDGQWNGELREVELWENERWNSEGKGWGKAWLKSGDRASWTRARDGCSAVSGGDVKSVVVFSLVVKG